MEAPLASQRRSVVFRLTGQGAALSARSHRAWPSGTEHLSLQGLEVLVGNPGVWGYETPVFFQLIHPRTGRPPLSLTEQGFFRVPLIRAVRSPGGERLCVRLSDNAKYRETLAVDLKPPALARMQRFPEGHAEVAPEARPSSGAVTPPPGRAGHGRPAATPRAAAAQARQPEQTGGPADAAARGPPRGPLPADQPQRTGRLLIPLTPSRAALARPGTAPGPGWRSPTAPATCPPLRHPDAFDAPARDFLRQHLD